MLYSILFLEGFAMLAHEVGQLVTVVGPLFIYLWFLEKLDRSTRVVVEKYEFLGMTDGNGNELDFGLKMTGGRLLKQVVIGAIILAGSVWLSTQ